MAKRHPKDLKGALQALLDRKFVDSETHQTQTGAELVACVMFAQAQDPTSPHYGKVLDIITKLTHTSEREKLQAEKLQIEVTARTAPPMGYELDPFSQSMINTMQNEPIVEVIDDPITDETDEGDLL